MSRFYADENPFDLVKASDFSDTQIFEYWVDLTGDSHGLLNLVKPRLKMPMLLLGGKGSGKTHLLRYCSAAVQSMRVGDLWSAVLKEGFLGTYVRADGLNHGQFSGKGQSEETWSTVFGFYFELWVVIKLLENLRILFSINASSGFMEELFVGKIIDLFNVVPVLSSKDLSGLIEHLKGAQKNIDFSVNNASMTRKIDDIVVTFSPGKLLFGIPSIIVEMMEPLRETIFLYMFDEIENFTLNQQKFINTLIRYRSGNATIKIGARLYGMLTYETLGSGEPIRQNAEFELVELDAFLRSRADDYRGLIKGLICKRLERAGIMSNWHENDELENAFESIQSADYYSKLINFSVEPSLSSEERPYFVKLRKQLAQFLGDGEKVLIERIVKTLELPKYPLLEKFNILMFYKKASGSKDYINVAQAIAEQSAALLLGDREKAREYDQLYKHFDSDMLAQLHRDYKHKIPYAGLDNLVHYSQGVPRNLLGILKNVYRRSLFAGEKPFQGGLISIQSQTDGVMDSATWFWDDSQPDKYGNEVRDAIDNLAELFRTVRYSHKPSECDICSFNINPDDLTENSRNTLKHAENWSYLIKIRDGSKNKNSKRIDLKYQLSPMLAPRWGLSPHRRGTIELQSDLANSIFDRECRNNFDGLVKARVARMMAPALFGRRPEATLPGLF